MKKPPGAKPSKPVLKTTNKNDKVKYLFMRSK